MGDRTRDMTEAELAEYYNEHGFDPSEWGEPEPVSRPERLDVSISVRFSPSEIALLRAEAKRRGEKVTAYIRRAAIDAQDPVPRDRLAQELALVEEHLSRLASQLHPTPRPQARPRPFIGRETAEELKRFDKQFNMLLRAAAAIQHDAEIVADTVRHARQGESSAEVEIDDLAADLVEATGHAREEAGRLASYVEAAKARGQTTHLGNGPD